MACCCAPGAIRSTIVSISVRRAPGASVPRARTGVQPGKAAELRMHARARPRRTRNACAAGVQKWRFAGVETARPCPPESLRASLPVPWSLSTLPASIRRSQRLLRSFWRLGDRDFRQPTSALSRPTIWGWSFGGNAAVTLCCSARPDIWTACCSGQDRVAVRSTVRPD